MNAKEVTFAQIVTNANKDKPGRLGELAKEIEENGYEKYKNLEV